MGSMSVPLMLALVFCACATAGKAAASTNTTGTHMNNTVMGRLRNIDMKMPP